MQDRRFINLSVVLILLFLSVTDVARASMRRSKQEPISMNFLELIRAGCESTENDPNFSKICQRLNDILHKKEGYIQIMRVQTETLIVNDVIECIDWGIAYDDYEIGPVSARVTFFIEISENKKIKIQGISDSISNLKDLARDYIFYPDSASKRIVNEVVNVRNVGDVEISSAVPIVYLYLPEDGDLSTSDWHFFFNCLRELIELYEDERNKTSLRIFNREYNSLSPEEKENIVDVSGYNIRIEIVRGVPPIVFLEYPYD